jgi:hypothetical protein
VGSSYRTGVSRRQEWTIVAIAAVASAALFAVRGHAAGAGDVVDAPLTLIPSDRDQLACAIDHPVGAFRCAFLASGAPAEPAVAKEGLLAPYMTTERVMYLIPGLFEQPAFSNYFSLHHGDGRFTMDCKLRLVSFEANYRVRFRPSDDWGNGAAAWVAAPVSCKAR